MSEIVVDLGCQRHGTDYSIEPLIDRFAPMLLLGFDPAATPPLRYDIEQTTVVIDQSVAWTHDGSRMFSARTGIEGTVMVSSNAWNGKPRTVPCFDFSTWLHDLDAPDVVVKMDIEGAEVPVLEKLIADGNDERIGLLLIEWHDFCFDNTYGVRRAAVEKSLRCPVEIWH